jgi:predicted nucleic acid-binding protein
VILVDSSVWIDHFRLNDAVLAGLLDSQRVLTHPFVIGELALGSLKQRNVILSALRDLPRASVASDDEVLDFIAQHELFGQGVGYIDAHLLASVRLTPNASLWTRDKRLRAVADGLSLSAKSTTGQ